MWGVTVDDSGQVWLTQYSGKGSVNPGGTIVPGGHGRLLRFDPRSEEFSTVDIPTNGSFPFRIVTDPQGRVWFTELLGNKLSVYDPTSNSLQEFSVPSAYAGPADLTFDTQGNLWFTEAYNESVAEFQPATQQFQEYHLSSTDPSRFISSPVGIAISGDGHVWFADHGGNWIVEFDPTSQKLQRFPTGFPRDPEYTIAIPNGLLIDGHGRIWFSEHWGNAIGYYDPTFRTMVEYPIPTGPISTALWITQAPDGQVWFTEWETNKIGVVHSQLRVPASVHLSESQVSLAAGAEITIPYLVESSQLRQGYGNLTYSWSSYEPTDVQVSFQENRSVTGYADTPGQAQVKISDKVSPGNYTLSIGADIGFVRVWSMVQTQVTLTNPNQQGTSTSFAISQVLIPGIAVLIVAVALLFFRRLRRKNVRSAQTDRA
jgi:streptogramin lyase